MYVFSNCIGLISDTRQMILEIELSKEDNFAFLHRFLTRLNQHQPLTSGITVPGFGKMSSTSPAW